MKRQGVDDLSLGNKAYSCFKNLKKGQKSATIGILKVQLTKSILWPVHYSRFSCYNKSRSSIIKYCGFHSSWSGNKGQRSCNPKMAGGIKKSKIGSIRSIFMHADSLDCFLMVLGLIGSIGEGFSSPLIFFVSSKLLNNLAGADSASDVFSDSINKVSFPFFFHFHAHTRTKHEHKTSN